MCLVGEYTEETIRRHLLTLGSNDFVSIIPYDASLTTNTDSNVVPEGTHRLWRATDSNMAAAQEEGRRHRPVGMETAFQLAFNISGRPSVDNLDKVGLKN